MTREEAIEIIESTSIMVIGCNPSKYEEALGTVIEELEQSTWIPCNIKQPKKTGFYWVTKKLCDKNFISKEFFNVSKGWVDKEHGKNVIAWMPLIEPYKEGK